MNLSKKVLGKVIGYIRAAAYSSFTSEFQSLDAEGFYPWEVVIHRINDDDGEHAGDEFSLCGVYLGLVNRGPLERCKFTVEHGLGFSSDVNLEAYRDDAHASEYYHLTPETLIPSKSEVGKSFCVTVSWRLKPICHAYVLLNSNDTNLVKKDFRNFVVRLDRQLWLLGSSWLIGGALPDSYIRLGEDDIIATTAAFDGYSLDEKAS